MVSVAETRRIQLPKNSNRESHKLISCSNSGVTETRFRSEIGDQVRNEGKLKIEKKQRIRNIRTEEVGDCKQSPLGESKTKFFLSGIETKACEKSGITKALEIRQRQRKRKVCGQTKRQGQERKKKRREYEIDL